MARLRTIDYLLHAWADLGERSVTFRELTDRMLELGWRTRVTPPQQAVRHLLQSHRTFFEKQPDGRWMIVEGRRQPPWLRPLSDGQEIPGGSVSEPERCRYCGSTLHCFDEDEYEERVAALDQLQMEQGWQALSGEEFQQVLSFRIRHGNGDIDGALSLLVDLGHCSWTGTGEGTVHVRVPVDLWDRIRYEGGEWEAAAAAAEEDEDEEP